MQYNLKKNNLQRTIGQEALKKRPKTNFKLKRNEYNYIDATSLKYMFIKYFTHYALIFKAERVQNYKNDPTFYNQT